MILDFQNRVSRVETLPDGRYIVTDVIDVLEYVAKKKAKFEASVALSWGTEHAEYSGCRLIKQGMAEPSVKPSQDRTPYVRIYETLSATAETQVGQPTKVRLDDGRDAWEYTYRQFTTGTFTPGTIGTDTAPGNGALYLQKVEAPDDGTVRTITRTYVAAGLLAQDDQIRNNGALLLRTLTYAKTVPPTPAGYTLIGYPVKSPNGLPIYTYSFAKGDGQISYEPTSDQNGALLRISIRHLTAPGASNPISTPGGYTLVSGPTYQEAEGHMIWTAGFAKGDGQISSQDSAQNNGALTVRTIRHLTAPAGSNPISTPSGFVATGTASYVEADGHRIWMQEFARGIGEISRGTNRGQNGTTTDGSVGVTRLSIAYLTAPGASEPAWSGVSGYIQISVQNSERDGHELWNAVYAKGAGLVAQSIEYDALPGLRRVTNISLGTKVTPTGIVVRDDYREDEGYRLFTVTTWQTDTGGADPTAASASAERYVSFTYPGRAKAFTETFDGKLMLAAFLSPPVTTQVKATVTISYVTSNALGTISDFWNPSNWATIKKQWVGSYGRQTSEIRALPGYRTTSATPVSYTGDGTDSAIEGSVIYAGTEARITITGGPADPGGSTWTLDARIDPEPVFTSTAGTRYYRRTDITAAIPSQAALPV